MTDVPDDFGKLAEAYLQSLESDHSNVGEIENELEYWSEQVEEFEKGTPMYEMAVEERDHLREHRDEISEAGETQEHLRNELLMRTTADFAPMGEWPDETVVSAITHALTGRRQDFVKLGNYSLPRDAAELSKREKVSAAKNVHAVCKAELGSGDVLDDAWNKMTTKERHPITQVLARESTPMKSDEIAALLDEEATDNPGANLRYVVNSSEYQPYYRESGAWTLSLIGEYLWDVHGSGTTGSEEDDMDNDGGDLGNGGASLDDVGRGAGGAGDE